MNLLYNCLRLLRDNNIFVLDILYLNCQYFSLWTKEISFLDPFFIIPLIPDQADSDAVLVRTQQEAKNSLEHLTEAALLRSSLRASSCILQFIYLFWL